MPLPAPRSRLPLHQSPKPIPARPSQPQAPPEAPLSKATIKARLRPWVLAAAVVVIVVTCTLSGAALKEEWQRRQARSLFAKQEEEKRKAIAVGGQTPVEEKAPLPAKDSGPSIQPTAQRVQQRQPSTQSPEDQKKIVQKIHDLESRRGDLLRKRGVLADKVERLQERMRKREEDERLQQERAREGD